MNLYRLPVFPYVVMSTKAFVVNSVYLIELLPVWPILGYSFHIMSVFIKSGIDAIRCMAFLWQLYALLGVFRF